ncbi:GMC family oxidoreductase N-terminal domain-containing protein [Sphingomonas sp. Ant20]|uniref:GMC family oxidoreductase N-terminal domain-containing protein n=1 Tax=Sphingomonas sp. Ant20 TaxID=104605 RepID=UPI0027423355|nr:GMC family oxidoreductase N-terminal domain-containing protein [Sphingomonas sp. Ant20]
MDTTYLPLAVAHGAEIRARARVVAFDYDGRGRISAVVYSQNGQEHRQLCAAVFLCAGGIETPRLLLNLGIANSSGQVGRNFMAHVATRSGAGSTRRCG